MKRPDPLRERFSQIVDEPWFEIAFDAYQIASDRDDEWGMDRIIDQLVEAYMLAGHADPGGKCWDCNTRKLELAYDRQCNACLEADEARAAERQRKKAAHEAWFNSLSLEKQLEHTAQNRYFLDGLISRDVQ